MTTAGAGVAPRGTDARAEPTADRRPPDGDRRRAALDLVIRDARLRDADRPPGGSPVVSIGVRDGRITALDADPADAEAVVDADGALVTASFVDAHLHLDKVHTWDLAGTAARHAYTADGMRGAADAIGHASAVKDAYDEAAIGRRARRVLLDGLHHGVTHVRAFADTDTRAGLRGVRPLLALRDELRGLVDVEVVAFPQDGVVRDPGAAGTVAEALELGADLVGGIPWIEETDDAAAAHVRRMVELAVTHDRDVAMLTDDAGDARLRTTAMLAEAAIEHGLVDRVTACHARALANYAAPRLDDLIGLARRARLAFVANPHTAPIALPIGRLLDAGLPVALAQDDIADAYYPFGTHNLLEVAFLAAHARPVTTLAEMDRLIDMITVHAARALRLPGHGRVRTGAPADLLVHDAADVREALARHAAPRQVVRHGNVVETGAATSSATIAPPAAAPAPEGHP